MPGDINIRAVKINTPERFALARESLGMDKVQMAAALRLGAHGREAVRRYEDGGNTRGIPGGVQIAMEAFVSGWRPRGVRFPCDGEG